MKINELSDFKSVNINAVTTNEQAINIFKHYLQDKENEHFYAMITSKRKTVILKIAEGYNDKVKINTRILKDAITEFKGISVVIAHNHESSSISLEDIEATKLIAEELRNVGATLVEHYIFHKGGITLMSQL